MRACATRCSAWRPRHRDRVSRDIPTTTIRRHVTGQGSSRTPNLPERGKVSGTPASSPTRTRSARPARTAPPHACGGSSPCALRGASGPAAAPALRGATTTTTSPGRTDPRARATSARCAAAPPGQAARLAQGAHGRRRPLDHSHRPAGARAAARASGPRRATCDTGTADPLADLSPLAREHELWTSDPTDPRFDGLDTDAGGLAAMRFSERAAEERWWTRELAALRRAARADVSR
jgi:hypothetical protein